MRRTLVFLGITVLALVAVGFVVLVSAGSELGLSRHRSAYYFISRQAIWLVGALVACVLMAWFDYRTFVKKPWLTALIYFATLAVLAAVFAFPAVKGSRRWIDLGFFHLQPGELAKSVVVLSVSAFLARAGWRVELVKKGVLPAAVIVALPALLVLAEPDFGSTAVIGVASAALFWIGGMKLAHIFSMGALGALGVFALLLQNANRMRRLLAWFPASVAAWAKDAYPALAQVNAEGTDAAKYQLQHALKAFENAGLWGVGFNNSMQKQVYLPEAHTDFIFAIGAEEWGVPFSVLLIALFTAFFLCGLRIARNAPDPFGKFLAFGMSFVVFFQALFNVGVVMGCLPTKGIALPFISYGGTNLIVSFVAVGVLFSVGRRILLQNSSVKSSMSGDFS